MAKHPNKYSVNAQNLLGFQTEENQRRNQVWSVGLRISQILEGPIPKRVKIEELKLRLQRGVWEFGRGGDRGSAPCTHCIPMIASSPLSLY